MKFTIELDDDLVIRYAEFLGVDKEDYLSFKAQYPILSVAGWGCKPKPIGLITFRF